jgi:drug/metabolite transporter (DMT)-like permease
LLSYAGIGLAFAHDLQLAGDTRSVLIGAAFVFGSALTYAGYSAGAEVAVHRIGSARFSALGLLVSTAAAQIHFLLSEPLEALIQPWPVYAYGAGMALFSTVLPVFWHRSRSANGSARTVLIGTLGPTLSSADFADELPRRTSRRCCPGSAACSWSRAK